MGVQWANMACTQTLDIKQHTCLNICATRDCGVYFANLVAVEGLVSVLRAWGRPVGSSPLTQHLHGAWFGWCHHPPCNPLAIIPPCLQLRSTALLLVLTKVVWQCNEVYKNFVTSSDWLDINGDGVANIGDIGKGLRAQWALEGKQPLGCLDCRDPNTKATRLGGIKMTHFVTVLCPTCLLSFCVNNRQHASDL